MTSAAGAVTDRVQYSVYGRITLRTGSTDTPFLYNGRYGVQTDANGLYYMRARYYNPYICRFINADPAGFGGGMNWYAFADGSPISLVDPFGLGAAGEHGAVYSMIATAHDFTAAAIDNVFNMGLSLFLPQAEPGAGPKEQQMYAVIGENFMQTFGSPLAKMGLYQPGGGPDNAAQVTMAVLPLVIKAPEIEVPESGILKYEVGTYDSLRSRSLSGDGLDVHHVGQAHPMEDLIPGYDRATAPAIALPEAEHSLIPTLRGPTSMSPRDVLVNDIRNLRNITVAPNAVLQQLIELNNKMYPGAFKK